MKHWFYPAIALLITGCASNTQQSSTPPQATMQSAAQSTKQPIKLTTEQELTKYCRVCVVDKGEKIEEFLPSRLDTKKGGKTYKFCSDDCQKKFVANSKPYALN